MYMRIQRYTPQTNKKSEQQNNKVSGCEQAIKKDGDRCMPRYIGVMHLNPCRTAVSFSGQTTLTLQSSLPPKTDLQS